MIAGLTRSLALFSRLLTLSLPLLLGSFVAAQEPALLDANAYFKLGRPRPVLTQHQRWEGDQFPHTLSAVEMNRGGFRYWGWYGLNEGRGIGLARSNDLVHWVKYQQNPLLKNGRWPSVLAKANPDDPGLIYVAYTRDYDTPTSYILLGSTRDGVHITPIKMLVQPITNQRNQNPNLFRDPRTGRFYLTWYRGYQPSEIVSRSAERLEDLDTAPEKILVSSGETLAAPTLLYVPRRDKPESGKGVHFLSTEIHPGGVEWQTKIFEADSADGPFKPVVDNPVLRGGRACLFQHVFNNRFFGYVCREISDEAWALEVVQSPVN